MLLWIMRIRFAFAPAKNSFTISRCMGIRDIGGEHLILFRDRAICQAAKSKNVFFGDAVSIIIHQDRIGNLES